MIRYNIGDKYGRLTIVDAAPPSDKYPKKRMVRCVCDCGSKITCPITYLVNGIATSCGCRKYEPRVDYTGRRFGRLVAVKPTGEVRDHSAVWQLQCDCGNMICATIDSVQSGRTGCGCTKRQSELENAKAARANQAIVSNANLSTLSSSKVYVNNSSGYRGVCYHRGTGKWVARITVAGKVHGLGYYSTPEAAHLARLQAEEELVRPLMEANADKYPEILKRFLCGRDD